MKRGLFELIFGKRPPEYQSQTTLKMMNGYLPTFSSFGSDAYSSDIVRAAIHAIASNSAKLKAKHIIRRDDIKVVHSNIERLLTLRPNPYMNAYDFLYKVVTQLYMKSNAFIFMQTDGANVIGFYPISAANMEFVEVMGEVYCKFNFLGGNVVTLPYSEIIHLRRFYNDNDLFGEPNDAALLPTLELIKTTDQGIINAIQSSASLRGIIKFVQAMMKPEDIKRERDRFVAEYLSLDNNGGIGALDSKAEFIQMNNEPKLVDDKQMAIIEDKVYKYFNINKSIVMSDYSEDQFNAFHESVIEPIALQLGLEITSKVFSNREKGFGNEIIFEGSRYSYLSNKTKADMISKLMPLGILNRNEAREIFNLAPVEDGEKYIVSLNYVQTDKQNEYQVGKTI